MQPVQDISNQAHLNSVQLDSGTSLRARFNIAFGSFISTFLQPQIGYPILQVLQDRRKQPQTDKAYAHLEPSSIEGSIIAS